MERQVGAANCFIDLAIRHHDKPDAKLLGVKCDGSTNYSAGGSKRLVAHLKSNEASLFPSREEVSVKHWKCG
ncbi:hypothetical protein [Synechococcus sp. CBW1108]|uniref:hypothetical protein n=1 Tax=Synechococcus sp. CBW1108 TaxID=1353147 RepID=UPI00351C9631